MCNAIWKILQPIYLQCPQEEKEWIRIAKEFNNIWNFPNCIGAIDGKHCRIQAPPNSGSAFYNYKSYFSLILMAIADARYRFIWVDIGDYDTCYYKTTTLKTRSVKNLYRYFFMFQDLLMMLESCQIPQ